MRIALGAERKDIYGQVLERALTLSGAGCLLGLLLSVLVSSFLRSSLYHVNRFDLTTMFLTPLLLLSVALFASYWPARWAGKVDPMVALRYE